MSSAVIPEIEEIKKEFRDLQNKYQEYLSKVDPDLIYDLLINAQENPKVTPMYMLEVFTKPGADSQGVRNCIYEKTGMVPSIYDNGTHYVTNQKLTLEMLKEISDHEDVLEVTGVYTGGVGGLGASHEQTDHSGHAYDYDESLFSPISLAEEQEEELGAGKQQPETSALPSSSTTIERTNIKAKMKTPDYNKNFRRLLYTVMGVAGAIALIGLIISGGKQKRFIN